MTAAAFAIMHGSDGEAGFAFHEALVEREDGLRDLASEGFAGLAHLGALGVEALAALGEGRQILLDQ